MKVILSNKAYIKPTEELWEFCSTQTTYQVQDKTSRYPKIFRNSGSIGKEVKWIPITRLDLLEAKKVPIQIIDKRVRVPARIPVPKVPLRLDQKEIYSQCTDTCIINGKPGFGKTILALWIAHKLGQKTLVVCTNTMIRAQWEKEVFKLFGFKAGVIGSGKFDTAPPIVVGNIQSIKKYSLELSKMFGLVIVDEVHHCVASTFTEVLESSHARYRIGLSGTLKRKDGLDVMFKDFFGFTIYSPAVANTLTPIIHRYQVPIEISGNMIVPWADRASAVYFHPLYKRTLVSLALLYYKLGHRVLLVSDRTKLLAEIRQELESAGVIPYFIVGSTDLDSRDNILEAVAEEESAILLASQSIFAEGVSLNELSCAILASLINNESLVEQLVGRVQRMVRDKPKLDPVVVDLMMSGGVGFNQASGRMSVYHANGWDVKYISNEDALEMTKIAFGNSQ
ncbi:putative ATP-dependent helicase [Pectobacterium phage DU_PP_V]|uniref:Putative ATP-dependent helicase n=1 Tax=Pectobacterium phage DU_PP_V TaxID=2041492 RepID=A0A2D2W710_9CAUD|nr:putative ATP-dependent helicase [Pectobacterium phage DU_PP_V]ATS94082.1 putative ATP-dependent helicase [Pectobacterium phage DU_PP_V]